MPQPHVQIILADDSVPATLDAALKRVGASAGFWPLTAALERSSLGAADAFVVLLPGDGRGAGDRLRVLLDRLADCPRATLVLKSDGGFVPRIAHPPTVPVTFGSGISEDELAIRLATMLEMRRSLESLHRSARCEDRSRETSNDHYVAQLRQASRVQRELLAGSNGRYGGVSFTTIYRPEDYVSGDIYDISRLDEEHIGIAIADATGHGIPAALLTVFIKRALRGREAWGDGYRILQPDQVLSRLNEDLLSTNFSDCQFVACAYALLNTRTHELSFSRGGVPYPILRRRRGAASVLKCEGGVLGIQSGVQFPVQRVQLDAGDSLLFYSDGLERVVSPSPGGARVAGAFGRAARYAARPALASIGAGGEDVGGGTCVATLDEPDALVTCDGDSDVSGDARHALLAGADEFITTSDWFQTLAVDGMSVALDRLNVRYDALRRIGFALDDLTAVAIQVHA
ncbi:Phosphoserine phosphatase RsbU [Phycisphaerae bacterium RAS1]|nr:Phosphoserine phosphatase RsbU [Phycisphaerae bacterium RAS1]